MTRNWIKRVTFTTFIVLFYYPIFLYSQNDAFTNEVNLRNGKVYFKGNLLSGLLFSEEDGIPNDCDCILKAKYKDGLIDGKKEQWYINGKLKYSGSYKKGSEIGEHKYFRENGNLLKKMKYKNGELIEKYIYYSNGKIKKEEKYQNGNIISSVIHKKKPKQNKSEDPDIRKKTPPNEKKKKPKKKEEVVEEVEPIEQEKVNKDTKQSDVESQTSKGKEDEKVDELQTKGGVYIEYFPDSSKQRVMFYKFGLLVKDSIFSPTHSLKMVKKYVDGELVYEENYNDEGVVIEEFNYQNNKKNGVQSSYYSNGNIRLIEKYDNGDLIHSEVRSIDGILTEENNYLYKKKDGIQQKYSDAGDPLSIQKYARGVLLEETNYSEKGRINKVFNGQLIEYKEYNLKDVLILSQYLDVSTGEKDSTYFEYDDLGRLVVEKAFNKGKFLRTGRYVDQKKNGLWVYYPVDGKSELRVFFEDGKEKSRERIYYARQVKNLLKDGDMLYRYFTKYPDLQENYIMLTIENVSDTLNLKIVKELERIFLMKLVKVNPLSCQGEQIKHKVIVKDIKSKLQIKNVKARRKKYVFIVQFSLELTDYDGKRKFINKYLFTPATSTDIPLNRFYEKDWNKAVNMTIDKININDFIYKVFPLKGKVTRIVQENSSEVKKLEINIGHDFLYREGIYLYVFKDNSKIRRARLVVENVSEKSSICRVIGGGKWLKEFLKKSPNPMVIEEKYLPKIK